MNSVNQLYKKPIMYKENGILELRIVESSWFFLLANCFLIRLSRYILPERESEDRRYVRGCYPYNHWQVGKIGIS
jgi:hypothetical protein